jgi:hypothetical protein
MKLSHTVLTAMLMYCATACCQVGADSKDLYAESTVAPVLRDSGNNVLTSSTEKAINRLGDRAAVGIMRRIGGESPTKPEEVRRILSVIKLAFAVPDIITYDGDRAPRATSFLLDSLSRLPASAGLQDEIQNVRRSLSEKTLNNQR